MARKHVKQTVCTHRFHMITHDLLSQTLPDFSTCLNTYPSSVCSPVWAPSSPGADFITGKARTCMALVKYKNNLIVTNLSHGSIGSTHIKLIRFHPCVVLQQVAITEDITGARANSTTNKGKTILEEELNKTKSIGKIILLCKFTRNASNTPICCLRKVWQGWTGTDIWLLKRNTIIVLAQIPYFCNTLSFTFQAQSLFKQAAVSLSFLHNNVSHSTQAAMFSFLHLLFPPFQFYPLPRDQQFFLIRFFIPLLNISPCFPSINSSVQVITHLYVSSWLTISAFGSTPPDAPYSLICFYFLLSVEMDNLI